MEDKIMQEYEALKALVTDIENDSRDIEERECSCSYWFEGGGISHGERNTRERL